MTKSNQRNSKMDEFQRDGGVKHTSQHNHTPQNDATGEVEESKKLSRSEGQQTTYIPNTREVTHNADSDVERVTTKWNMRREERCA